MSSTPCNMNAWPAALGQPKESSPGHQMAGSPDLSPGCNVLAHAIRPMPTVLPFAACMPPKKRCWPNSAWAKRLIAASSSWMNALSTKNTAPILLKRAENHDIRYQRCRVSEIHQDPASGDLILNYAAPNGELQQERFEMVVLATGLQPPDSAKHFTKF